MWSDLVQSVVDVAAAYYPDNERVKSLQVTTRSDYDYIDYDFTSESDVLDLLKDA